jgi:hypothetical protein
MFVWKDVYLSCGLFSLFLNGIMDIYMFYFTEKKEGGGGWRVDS